MNTNNDSTAKSAPYVGRFAPSPSGPLHFGSLLAALASYLDAQRENGQWLLRIDDLDPPREAAGAADTILRQLEAHGLHWHGTILYQSQRHTAYQMALEQLRNSNLCFPCDCSRLRITTLAGRYDGHCRQHPPAPNSDQSIRLRVTNNSDTQSIIAIDDLIQGKQCWNLATSGDFIIKRKDQLFAYQLACAVDDLHQNISHIIRGSDLLDSTPRQIHIMKLLTGTIPHYGHIPVATKRDGQKLSKQNLATAIQPQHAVDNLHCALAWLQHPAPNDLDSVEDLLQWGIANWQRQKVPACLTIPAP